MSDSCSRFRVLAQHASLRADGPAAGPSSRPTTPGFAAAPHGRHEPRCTRGPRPTPNVRTRPPSGRRVTLGGFRRQWKARWQAYTRTTHGRARCPPRRRLGNRMAGHHGSDQRTAFASQDQVNGRTPWTARADRCRQDHDGATEHTPPHPLGILASADMRCLNAPESHPRHGVDIAAQQDPGRRCGATYMVVDVTGCRSDVTTAA